MFYTVSKVSKLEEVSHEMLVLLLPPVSSRVTRWQAWHFVTVQHVLYRVESVKIGGSLARNARFAAPSCLVSSLWFSCGIVVSMGEASHHTPHSSLHTLHSTIHTPHFTLYTPHSTIYTLDPSLHTLHFTLRTLHFALRTLHSTLYTPHSTLHTLHSPLHTLHSTTLYTLHTLTPHTLHSTLYTPHFPLHAPHSTLYTPHFTL